MRDGVDEDDPLLVDAVSREVLPTRGMEVDRDQVVITLGSQHGLDLLARTLLSPGETVGVEDPPVISMCGTSSRGQGSGWRRYPSTMPD